MCLHSVKYVIWFWKKKFVSENETRRKLLLLEVNEKGPSIPRVASLWWVLGAWQEYLKIKLINQAHVNAADRPDIKPINTNALTKTRSH